MASSHEDCVLLTGASVGLGLAVAQRLIKRRFRLILTAREDSMHRFATAGIRESERVWLRPMDVMEPGQRKAVTDEANDRWGGVDSLVNNAGFAFRSVLEHVEQAELLQQMITNFWGPMELVRLVLPGMRERRKGRILNVSSVGGMMAMPTMAVFSASKFALEGASESLYYEVKPWNVHVTLIEPGFIRSDSFQHVRYTTQSGASMRDPSEAYFGHYRFMTDFIGKLMRLAPADTSQVAKRIEQILDAKRPPLRVAATPDALLFDWFRRFAPRSLYHWALYRGLPFPDCWGDENRLRARCQIERSKFT